MTSWPDELLSVVRAVPCGLFFVGADGRIALANPAAEQIFGYAPGELFGRSVEDLVPPGVMEDHRALRARFVTEGRGRQMGRGRHIVGIRKDGERVSVEIGLSPPVSSLGVTLVSVVDVSLTSRNLDGIAVIGEEGELLFLNPAASTLLGVAPGEGRFPLPPLTGEMLVVELTDAEGRRRWVEALMADVPWEGRRAVLASLRDVTERRRLEEQLHAERRTSLVGRLAAGVAHNFNNALQAILSGVEEAQRAQSAEQREALLRGVRDVARSSSVITRRLMEVGGVQPDSAQRAVLDEAVGEFVPVLRSLLGDAIDLRYEEFSDHLQVEADASQVHQLLLELVTNARDVLEDGGHVALRVDALLEETPICACGQPLASGVPYARLEVEDDGPGIPADDLDRIFEPFFTTKPGGGAAGLGLAASRAIMDRIGGHLCARSPGERGAVFTLVLPCRSAEVNTRQPAAAPRAARILVVDDERLIRTLVARHLEHDGHEVATASGGPEALEILTHRRFDLLLTDVVMPEMNGFNLAWEARRRQPALRCLFVSGYSGSTSLADLQSPEEELDLLVKPFGMKELSERVRAALVR